MKKENKEMEKLIELTQQKLKEDNWFFPGEGTAARLASKVYTLATGKDGKFTKKEQWVDILSRYLSGDLKIHKRPQPLPIYQDKFTGDFYTANIVKKPRDPFYNSRAWRELRYAYLAARRAACDACGRSPQQHEIVIHVDHIKPRSQFPKLELDYENLQLLCEDCNIGKCNYDRLNWKGSGQ